MGKIDFGRYDVVDVITRIRLRRSLRHKCGKKLTINDRRVVKTNRVKLTERYENGGKLTKIKPFSLSPISYFFFYIRFVIVD